MIVAAGLSPAWQQILVFDQFMSGEVNRAREAHWCASGKVLNVGLALGSLGANSATVAPLAGPARPQIEREFSELGRRARWTSADAPTRVCTTILDRSSGRTTELVENAGRLSPASIAEFLDAYSDEATDASAVVLTGSLPGGAPVDLYRRMLDAARCPAVLDVRGAELLAALDRKPFVVKPNREELAATVGRPLDADADLLAAMRDLATAGAHWAVATDGPRAAWLVSERSAYRITPPAVERVENPIGCGDSMAAGLAWALVRGESPVEAVRTGIAAAIDNLGQLLPARLSPERVAAICERIVVETVNG